MLHPWERLCPQAQSESKGQNWIEAVSSAPPKPLWGGGKVPLNPKS